MDFHSKSTAAIMHCFCNSHWITSSVSHPYAGTLDHIRNWSEYPDRPKCSFQISCHWGRFFPYVTKIVASSQFWLIDSFSAGDQPVYLNLYPQIKKKVARQKEVGEVIICQFATAVGKFLSMGYWLSVWLEDEAQVNDSILGPCISCLEINDSSFSLKTR